MDCMHNRKPLDEPLKGGNKSMVVGSRILFAIGRGRFLALKKASLHIEETPSSNGEVYLYVFSFLLVTNEAILSFYLKTRHKVGTDAPVYPPKHNQEEASPSPSKGGDVAYRLLCRVL